MQCLYGSVLAHGPLASFGLAPIALLFEEASRETRQCGVNEIAKNSKRRRRDLKPGPLD